MSSFDKKYQVESTRRTLESMVRDGLLEKVTVYEHRQNRMQYGGSAPGIHCMVSRYGLPGECCVTHDDGDDRRPHIEGESIRID